MPLDALIGCLGGGDTLSGCPSGASGQEADSADAIESGLHRFDVAPGMTGEGFQRFGDEPVLLREVA